MFKIKQAPDRNREDLVHNQQDKIVQIAVGLLFERRPVGQTINFDMLSIIVVDDHKNLKQVKNKNDGETQCQNLHSFFKLYTGKRPDRGKEQNHVEVYPASVDSYGKLRVRLRCQVMKKDVFFVDLH